MSDFEENAVKYTCAGVFCFGVLLTIILVPASIRDVAQDQYAVRYNDLTNEVYSDIYTEGKYVFTPDTRMFNYKRIVQKMSLSDLECLSSNGIVMDLTVDIQYQIPKEAVLTIFEEFGEQKRLRKYLKRVAAAAVRDSCGNYEASEFYESRSTIQDSMGVSVETGFRVSKTHVNITSVVLSYYDFPDLLNDAIKNKRAAENDIEIADNERDGKLVDAQTLLLAAEVNADTLLIEAQAEVESILIEAEAEATAIDEVWINRQNVYKSIMDRMNMTVDQFVLEYLTAVVLQNAGSPITTTV